MSEISNGLALLLELGVSMGTGAGHEPAKMPWTQAHYTMPNQKPLETLDDLLARAEAFAGFSMRSGGKVPPALFASSPGGQVFFMASAMPDVRAKDNFANTARLICVAHAATAAVMVLDAWMKVAKKDGSLDLSEPPSEALDRKEVVVITGETRGGSKQKILPIIRTDAGGFFGFGDYDGRLTSFTGRFSQILPPKKPSAEMQRHAYQLLAAMGVAAAAHRRDSSTN